MANRRMFAKSIVQSGKFLTMPPSTRLLYYDLGMAADDDGVAEAFTVMRMSGATVDDLRVLAAKGYIQVLNDDYVSLITDWKINNLIMKDKYRAGIYKDLIVGLLDGTEAVPERYRKGTESVPQVRLGEVRLDKVSVGEESVSAKAEPKHKYGEYKNVLLTDKELEKLQEEFPDWEQRIERLSTYIASKGAKYKSHLATIRAWARKDEESKPKARVYGDPTDFYK